MGRITISLDIASCAELKFTVTVWCGGCARGLQLPEATSGPKIVDLFRRLRCRHCGAAPCLLTVDRKLKGGSLSAEVLRLERKSPVTLR